MFIRATKTGTTKDGSPRITHRLVENQREGDKVRQKTLLNLGRHFDIERQYWPLLCQRIKELIDPRQPIFELTPESPKIEAEARRIAGQLVERQSDQTTANDLETVDINSASDQDGRSIGVEHAALKALEDLRLPSLLDHLGFNHRQRCCALGSIIGRMTEPGSERATAEWLRRASGELLSFDFGSISDMAFYRASDLLVKNRATIEDHLFGTVTSLFDLKPTITLYDLTNTFFEGQALKTPKAKRGRSKEKRSDVPLLTLGLVLDGGGFVRRSAVHAGNVFEAHTLETVLNSLSAVSGSCVIMDAGIASANNLAWLRANGYRYIVVSREQRRDIPGGGSASSTTVVSTPNTEVTLHRHEVERQKKDKEKTPYKEVLLGCYSEARRGKEKSILAFFRDLFEEKLREVHAKLFQPRTRKRLSYIQRKVGRLQEENSKVAKYYDIKVAPDETGLNACAVFWTDKTHKGSMMSHPGVYALRSNILDWESSVMWQTYTTLTDVEAVFRSLKSELGLRPIYHQTKTRSESHLLISVLAYQAVQLLRTRLKSRELNDSWHSLRKSLRPLQRTTTRFSRPDGSAIHIRKTATPDAIQNRIYQSMGVTPPARNVRKTIV